MKFTNLLISSAHKPTHLLESGTCKIPDSPGIGKFRIPPGIARRSEAHSRADGQRHLARNAPRTCQRTCRGRPRAGGTWDLAAARAGEDA